MTMTYDANSDNYDNDYYDNYDDYDYVYDGDNDLDDGDD